jgi:hypothetical protein
MEEAHRAVALRVKALCMISRTGWQTATVE